MTIEQPDPIQLHKEETGDCLSAARDLFSAFHQHEIRYCHWKSNIRLADSLAGRTDLDLLIDPQQQGQVLDILAAQGFKLLLASPGKRYPGLAHYLGFDWPTGRLLHLHVHFRLVMGEQFIKNYHLPLETHFLANTRWLHGIKVPQPALELVILAMRALLKYRDRDGIKDTLSIRSPGIPTPIAQELNWLLQQTSLDEVQQTLSALPGFLPGQAIMTFLSTFNSQRRDGVRLLRLRTAVRHSLYAYQRRSRLAASSNYFQALWRKSWQGGERQMGLPMGGRMIAMVGVDGSGKTSISTALCDWLNWKVDTHLLYLGSKQPSWRSTALYWLFRIARRSQREIASRWGENHLLARLIAGARQVLLAWHYLSVGHDRYRRYRLGNRHIQAGSVVIFDRFPFQAPLDGPEVTRVAKQGPLHLTYLVQEELKLYERFKPVDHLILLDAPVEASLQRKPDHPVEVIQQKNAAVAALKNQLTQNQWHWSEIDARPAWEEVLLNAKRAVWSAL